jgi:hypothetical protein
MKKRPNRRMRQTIDFVRLCKRVIKNHQDWLKYDGHGLYRTTLIAPGSYLDNLTIEDVYKLLKKNLSHLRKINSRQNEKTIIN